MPILNTLTAARGCSVLSIVDTVTGIWSLPTISIWTLFAIRHFMHLANILPQSVSCRFTQVNSPLLESVIYCILVNLCVPIMVSNLFMFERIKSMLNITNIASVNSLPINKFCSTLSAFSKWIIPFCFTSLLLQKTM